MCYLYDMDINDKINNWYTLAKKSLKTATKSAAFQNPLTNNLTLHDENLGTFLGEDVYLKFI